MNTDFWLSLLCLKQRLCWHEYVRLLSFEVGYESLNLVERIFLHLVGLLLKRLSNCLPFLSLLLHNLLPMKLQMMKQAFSCLAAILQLVGKRTGKQIQLMVKVRFKIVGLIFHCLVQVQDLLSQIVNLAGNIFLLHLVAFDDLCEENTFIVIRL